MNILVATHGPLAKALRQSAEMIMGELENVESYEFQPNQSLESLAEGMKERIHSFGNNEEVLVLVDLFGGSPCNAVALLLSEGYKIHAVSGVNLPMLLEVLGSRAFLDSDKLIEAAWIAGKNGIVDIYQKLMEA